MTCYLHVFFFLICRLSDLSKSMVRSVATEEVTWPVGLKDTRGGKKSDILKLVSLILCFSVSLSYTHISSNYYIHLSIFIGDDHSLYVFRSS